MSDLPPPSRARALLVGIEKYDLGEGFELEGAVADALAMADLLETQFEVPAERIELWLAPLADVVPTTRKWTPFAADAFDKRLTGGLQSDKDGGLLFLYWSGHGVVAFAEHAQYLVLPEADKFQFRSLRFDNVANLLLDGGHAQFSHQVLVIDACRSPLRDWGTAGVAARQLNPAPPDPLRSVEQCQLLACSLGQASAQLGAQGSALRQALEAVWKEGPVGQWPDFEATFKTVRKRVDDATNGQQVPTTASFANGWNGNRLGESDSLTEPSLLSLLRGVAWPADAGYRLHALRSLRSGSPRRPLPDLQSVIPYLADLPETDDVPPLCEFVARVVEALGGEAAPAPLRAWLGRHTTPLQRNAIAARLGAARAAHVLQLWLDELPQRLRAALFDPHDRLVDGWDRNVDRLVGGDPPAAKSLEAAIGDTLFDAADFVGDDELVLELCLPSHLLADGLEAGVVPSGGDTVRLGRDVAVVLRCTDRSKNRSKRQAWLDVAAAILARIGNSGEPVRWAESADAGALLKDFFGEEGARPIWIGIADAPMLATDHEKVLQICLAEGLPAVLWMRPRLEPAHRDDALARLVPLLDNAAQDLPRRLRGWRREQLGQRTEGTALLLDDPRRVPPWPVQMGASGMKKGRSG